MQEYLNAAKPAWQYQLNAYDVASNPVVNAYADAAINPLFQQFNEQIIPTLRSTGVATGNLGSSKQSLSEAQAAERTMRQAADVRAGIFNQAYNTGMAASQNAVNAIPMLQSSSMAGANALRDIGQTERQIEQARLDEQVARYQYNQAAPYKALMDYLNAAGGKYGGVSDTTVTGTPPDKLSQIFSILSGAATTLPGLIDIFRDIFKGNQQQP